MTVLNLAVSASEDDVFEDTNGSSQIANATGNVDQTGEWFGLRFRNVTIPQGAAINSATLSVKITSGLNDEPKVLIYAEDADDSAVFVTGGVTTDTVSGRPRTTASVAWDSVDLGVSGAQFKSPPDLASVIQEVVNRSGWASGNALSILIGGDDATGTRDLGIFFWDNDPADAATLVVDYTAAVQPIDTTLEPIVVEVALPPPTMVQPITTTLDPIVVEAVLVPPTLVLPISTTLDPIVVEVELPQPTIEIAEPAISTTLAPIVVEVVLPAPTLDQPPAPEVSAVIPRPSPTTGVFIHDPWPPFPRIAELPSAFNPDCAYIRMEPGVAALHISAQDPGLSRVKEGFRLVIETDDMPPWVGIILTVDENPQFGTIEIQASDLASILGGRMASQTERYERNIGSGFIFRSVLNRANLLSFTGIGLPTSVESGPSVEDFQVGGLTILDAWNGLHDRTDYEWWIDTRVSPRAIEATAYWGHRQGEERPDIHIELGVHCRASRRTDVTNVKQVTTVIGDFGAEVAHRASVTRSAIGGIISAGRPESATMAAIQAVADVPAGLRTEQILVDVRTSNLAEMSRRAKKALERPLPAAEGIVITVNRSISWRWIRVGNSFRFSGNMPRGPVDRMLRIVGAQPDRAAGECELVCEGYPI